MDLPKGSIHSSGGLKPIRRRVWAPRGERPLALGQHRYKWLYVNAFVEPNSEQSILYLSHRVNKPLFRAFLQDVAKTVAVGKDRFVILVLDEAGNHTKPNLIVPPSMRLV
ncbi:MAG: transposase [Fulvimarina manganoxydans]|uniref:transposase n=1 Tax=Fulvimarina manganoxydans TaxID=937218 RepID=UPI0023522996|nr:transposase [Fulvimarina manganoxydans]MCK5933381.1 transposase [Fulvimarina manganoxydans]